MLVDMARNDMGRVSEFGSVKVTDFMKIQYYSHVMHIVSLVEGRKKGTYHPFDLVASFLPAGTLSGAPKIRAMERPVRRSHRICGLLRGHGFLYHDPDND